jgi:hypothetical protein
MASIAKHALRTGIKTAIPIVGKPLADAIAPLGNRTIVDSNIKAFNPNTAYNQNMNMHTEGDRQSIRMRSEKIEAPIEDMISGVSQGAILMAAGALVPGAQPLIGVGMQRIGQGFASSGRKTEKGALEDASQWASLMANNLDMFKKGTPKDPMSNYTKPEMMDTLPGGEFENVMDSLKSKLPNKLEPIKTPHTDMYKYKNEQLDYDFQNLMDNLNRT